MHARVGRVTLNQTLSRLRPSVEYRRVADKGLRRGETRKGVGFWGEG